MNREQAGAVVESQGAPREKAGQTHVGRARLSKLLEEQRLSAHGLAELVAQIQTEADGPTTLSKEVFSALPMEIESACLVPEATVVVVDSSGNKHSRSLDKLPLEVAVAVVQECLTELRRILVEKQSLLTRRVKAIEQVADELEGSARSYAHEGVDGPASNVPAEDGRQTAEPSRVEEKGDEAFKFNGAFEEQRQALDGHTYPFTNASQPKKKNGH